MVYCSWVGAMLAHIKNTISVVELFLNHKIIVSYPQK